MGAGSYHKQKGDKGHMGMFGSMMKKGKGKKGKGKKGKMMKGMKGKRKAY